MVKCRRAGCETYKRNDGLPYCTCCEGRVRAQQEYRARLLAARAAALSVTTFVSTASGIGEVKA